ncbi:hypothetical protein ACT8ZV_07840 [Nocardioides sp. MAHUQ-72]|uniref:hypothetical protein n=1 Tax=unclassified Nocardioides TaxID=2615069 RepID=UPI0036214B15
MSEPQVPFSDSEFSSKFDEFETLLVDFGTITLALDAYQANQDWHHESTMGVEYRTSVMVGEKYPFSLTFTLYDFEAGSEDAARAHWEKERSGWASYADGWARGKVAELKPRFDTIIDPWPGHLESAASEFEDIRIVLGTQVPDDFAQLDYSESHWEGLTATNFFNNFYNLMPQCVDNQAWVAEMLQNACGAAKSVIDMGRNSAMNTVAAMVSRADEALRARQDAHSISPTEFLTITSTILDLIDIIPIAVPDSMQQYVEKFDEVTGDARSTASTLIGYAEDSIPEKSAVPQTAASQRPEGVVADFHTAIDSIGDNLTKAWDQLDVDYLVKVDKNIDALEELSLLWLRSPDLAQGPGGPGGFHHNSSNQYQ